MDKRVGNDISGVSFDLVREVTCFCGLAAIHLEKVSWKAKLSYGCEVNVTLALLLDHAFVRATLKITVCL